MDVVRLATRVEHSPVWFLGRLLLPGDWREAACRDRGEHRPEMIDAGRYKDVPRLRGLSVHVLVLTGQASPTERAVGPFPTIDDAHVWLEENGIREGRWMRISAYELVHPDDPTCGDYQLPLPLDEEG